MPKGWSLASAAIIVLSLLSWIVIYHLEGAAPTQAMTIALVGFWIVIVGVARLVIRRRGGGPAA